MAAKVSRRAICAVVVSVVTAAVGAGGIAQANAAELGAGFAIKSNQSGLVLDVTAESKSDGAAVVQYKDSGHKNQRWLRKASPSSPGYFSIVNVNSDKCLDIAADKILVNGQKLQQWSCWGGDNQKWKFVTDAAGTRIINKASNQALDVPSASSAAVQIQQWPLHGLKNQLWSLKGSTAPAAPASTTSTTAVSSSWKQSFSENFDKAATATTFDSTYANSWCGYKDGEGGGKYFKVISAHDGLMDISLDGTKGAAGSFGPAATCNGKTYGRYSIRFKVDGAQTYGAAMMIWPSSNIWGDGEIDFPEGDFAGEIHGYHHPMNCTDCASSDNFATGAKWSDWHEATTEWTASSVKYYLDGKLLKTVTHDIPSTKHRMTIQMAPTRAGTSTGHFLVDWVRIWDAS